MYITPPPYITIPNLIHYLQYYIKGVIFVSWQAMKNLQQDNCRLE